MTFDWLSLVACFLIGLCCGCFLPPFFTWVSKQIARRRILVMDYDNPCGSDCLIRRQPYVPTDADVERMLHESRTVVR